MPTIPVFARKVKKTTQAIEKISFVTELITHETVFITCEINSNASFFNFISFVINSITYEIISIPYVMKKITSAMNAVTYEIIFITDVIEKISYVFFCIKTAVTLTTTLIYRVCKESTHQFIVDIEIPAGFTSIHCTNPFHFRFG